MSSLLAFIPLVVGVANAQTSQSEFFRMSDAIALSATIGIVPIYVGLTNSFISRGLGASAKGFMACVAFGIAIFSLVDLFGSASNLGIDLRSTAFQMVLVFGFAVGLATPFVTERASTSSENMQAQLKTMAYMFALAVAFHGFAEGIVISYDLQSGYVFTFAHRIVQTTSFLIHKVAEGFVVSIPLLLARAGKDSFALVGIAASLPLVFGVASVYFDVPGMASSFGFALGAGALTYVLFKLGNLASLLGTGSVKMFAGILAGILLMYFAGWIHSIEL